MANSLSTFDEIINAIKFYAKSSKPERDAALGITRATATSNVSIASRAKLNVCQFPLLTSSTLSVNSYQKISDILEQLYAQYLKLVIVNQLEVINLGAGDNKLSIMSKVHQNDNALNTYIDRAKEEILKADIGTRFEDAIPFLEMYNFSDRDLIDANKALLKPYNENFNMSNLNRNEVLTEDYDATSEVRSKYEELMRLVQSRQELVKTKRELENDLYGKDHNNVLKSIERIENQIKDIDEDINEVENIIKKIAGKKTIYEFEKERAEAALKYQERVEKAKEKADKAADNAERAEFRKKFGSVTDFENALIKKNNALEPSILSFNLKYHTKGGSFEDTKMALAVKTITHMIQSDELCFYINETLNRKKKVFRAIQVLTGEKEFSLRFLLGLDRAKRDAKADSTTAKWWRHLQERRTASWIRTFRHKDPYIPNATIVLSHEDYEWLKLNYKKDLIKDTKMAYQLTDLLFLMHLVIVNDVSNEIMIFNKDSRNWETYTLDKLQTEINTMNKMSSNKALR